MTAETTTRDEELARAEELVDFEAAAVFFETPPTTISVEDAAALASTLAYKLGGEIHPINLLTWEELGNLTAEASRIGYEFALRKQQQQQRATDGQAAEAGAE